eukprot:CAMPEP_0172527332 /NCGR_PEP_ID=MMETSP1067-20121228/2048_1 /TAXON_ID=265564 ORGANISM="Thalassiosira punctigera, Strain Tpunct2005C2" /NCGR_SAMPLE_ID=MMETSP1067 /ASSEMBLY_ACC=CAM_ASM_000444 /LENGTH=69 /DNA_ID=CAMNT_0013311055 /DNA_START=236 /DNA_END=445 /DNA_ORIENTATION=+
MKPRSHCGHAHVLSNLSWHQWGQIDGGVAMPASTPSQHHQQRPGHAAATPTSCLTPLGFVRDDLATAWP